MYTILREAGEDQNPSVGNFSSCDTQRAEPFFSFQSVFMSVSSAERLFVVLAEDDSSKREIIISKSSRLGAVHKVRHAPGEESKKV